MAHILLLGDDLLVVCNRFDSQKRWLDKGYKRIVGIRAADAVERAVREGSLRTVEELWREAFGDLPPEPDGLWTMRSHFMEATSAHMPRLVVLRRVPDRRPRPFQPIDLPKRESNVPDAPPGHIMWIGFELLDDDGTPIPSRVFILTAPDGQQSTMRLNPDGRTRQDPTLDGIFGFALSAEGSELSVQQGYLEIRLVDGSGEPVGGAEYQVCVGSVVVRKGTVDREGRARADGLPPGPYKLVLPGFEPNAVSLAGVAAHAASGTSRPASTYKVRQGDTLAKIARAHGLKSWKVLYDAPENADLRKKRPNPHRIRPGDEVKIPGRKAAAVSVAGGGVTNRVVVAATVEPLTVEYTLTLAKELVDALGSELRFELSGVSHPESLSVTEGEHQGDDVSFAFRWEADGGSKATLEAVSAQRRTKLWSQQNVVEQAPKWKDGLLALLDESAAAGDESSSPTEMPDLDVPADVRLA